MTKEQKKDLIMRRKLPRDKWGDPLSKLAILRRQPQQALTFGALDFTGPYDPRRHPYVVTGIAAKDGCGFIPDSSGIVIWLDVTSEVAAGLRCGKTGNWLGETI